MSSSRRSGRTAHPHPPILSHSTSGASSSARRETTAHTERPTRSKPGNSSTPHSYSSDEIDDGIATVGSIVAEVRRSTRRGQTARDGDEHDDTHNTKGDDAGQSAAEGEGDEEEPIRCICGFQEYPGPPEGSHAPRPNSHRKSTAGASDGPAEEAASLFISCDTCKVWQHARCVGIVEEPADDDEYFCEMCRRDLHKIMTSPSGRRYSQYLPVSEQIHAKSSHRKSSVGKEPEARTMRDKQKQAKLDASDSFTKRRSTMNSRAAFEEEEMVRKAIEESKVDGVPLAGSGTAVGSVSTAGRKGKRSREESEDGKSDIKRPRTTSDASPRASGSALESDESTLESDAEDTPVAPHSHGHSRSRSNTVNGSSHKKSSRGTANARTREKEARERQLRDEALKGAMVRNGRLKRGEGGKPASAGAQYRDIYLMVSPADPERDNADLPDLSGSMTEKSGSNNASQQHTPEAALGEEARGLAHELDTPPAGETPKHAGGHGHQKKASISSTAESRARAAKSKKARQSHTPATRDQPTPPIHVGSPRGSAAAEDGSPKPGAKDDREGSEKGSSASHDSSSLASGASKKESPAAAAATAAAAANGEAKAASAPPPAPTSAATASSNNPPANSHRKHAKGNGATMATAAAGGTTTTTASTRFDKTSWADMRRTLNFISDYIARWEVELASPYNAAVNAALAAQGIQPRGVGGEAAVGGSEMEELDRVFDGYKAGCGMEAELVRVFRGLNTVQMRGVLQRRVRRLREEFPQFE